MIFFSTSPSLLSFFPLILSLFLSIFYFPHIPFRILLFIFPTIIPVFFLSSPLFQTTKCYFSLYCNCLQRSVLVVNARNQTSPVTIHIWLALTELHNCTYENTRYCGILNLGPHYGCIYGQLTVSSWSGIIFVACIQMRLSIP